MNILDLQTPVNRALSSRVAKAVDAQAKQCFQNATQGAIALKFSRPELSVFYVEGYALDTSIGYFPIEHAWIVANGQIVESTPKWRESAFLGNVWYMPTLAYPAHAIPALLYATKGKSPFFYRLPFGENAADSHQASLMKLIELVKA